MYRNFVIHKERDVGVGPTISLWKSEVIPINQSRATRYFNKTSFIIHSGRCGEIGIRARLKILWSQPPCGFDSRQRHRKRFSSVALAAEAGAASALYGFCQLNSRRRNKSKKEKTQKFKEQFLKL